ncbi:MAG: carbohydrate ABC transporter permease [Acutalibacteraceae bacterium]
MKNSSAVIKRKNPKMTASKKLFIIIFGLPTFLLYFYISILPMLKSVRVSFYDWSGYSPDMTFLGFDNYKEILSDPIFLKAMVNDLTIIFWKEILITVLALLFALAVTRFKLKKPEVAFIRFLFYIPDILSIIVISTVWLFIFNPNVGLLNGLLQVLHLDFLIPVNGWLTGGTLMPSIIFVAVWSGIGYFMIVLIAAINDVPKELYESAEIDGAGQWRQFIYVTMPIIWSQIRFVMVTILFSSISANMTLIMPLTNGGPDNASMVMGLYAYTVGVDPAVSRVGYANAAAVILMIISFTVSFIFNHLLAKKDDK